MREAGHFQQEKSYNAISCSSLAALLAEIAKSLTCGRVRRMYCTEITKINVITTGVNKENLQRMRLQKIISKDQLFF